MGRGGEERRSVGEREGGKCKEKRGGVRGRRVMGRRREM